MLASHHLDLACVAYVAKVASRKVFDPKQLKILTSKQMLQRLPKALAQVKAGNKSENLINEIRQVKKTLLEKHVVI